MPFHPEDHHNQAPPLLLRSGPPLSVPVLRHEGLVLLQHLQTREVAARRLQGARHQAILHDEFPSRHVKRDPGHFYCQNGPLIVHRCMCQYVPRNRRKVYSVNKSHYCPRCNRGFTLKKNMTRHLRHECGMAPKYQCPYCDKPSKFTQNIYAHIRKYHPGQPLCFRRLY